ncbi:MAG: hypothetical protein V3T17_15180 [Pseudomonadales bacterium]
MLLRIIDKLDAHHHENSIEVILQMDGSNIQFRIDGFSSPLTDNFNKTLAWYFQHYSQTLGQQKNDKSMPEKMLTLGQHLADELLGEDFNLVQIKESIENNGYEHLGVQIESSRIAFFQECWELLILHDSKYVLSAVSHDFVRRFIGHDQPDYEGELNYALAVMEATENTASSALGILHVISRSTAVNANTPPTNAYNSSVNALRWPATIRYELCADAYWPTLQQRLADKDKPIHIVHYDGPILLKDGMPQLCLAGDGTAIETIALSTFSALLVQHNIALLSVDAYAYQDEAGNDVSADLGLASVAHVAASAGLKNILGMSHLTDPWTSSQCFQAVYERLMSGLALGQAIVEARKFLQTQTETQRFSVNPIPFHPWPLLIHYGGQTVHFLSAPSQPVELSMSPAYETIRQQLLGFRHELLPPQVNHIEDNVLPGLLAVDQSAVAHFLSGAPGSGRTHLAHQAGFYLVQQKQVDYGFYFDCSTGFYSQANIQQMIAPIFDCSPEEIEKLESALATTCCYFVFDNLHQQALKQWPEATELAVSELKQFLAHLVQQGHRVLVTGMADEQLLDLPHTHIPITPLSNLSQSVLAADVLRRYKIADQDDDGMALLQSLQGNPWLIQRVMPQLAVDTAKDTLTQVSEWLDQPSSDSMIQRYYLWQWAKLSTVEQRWLMLLTDLPGVLLEMLMLACDPKAPADPIEKDTATQDSQVSPAPDKSAFEPAMQLFEQLGAASTEGEISLSSHLDQWARAGFLISYPHGRMLDPRCLSFLKAEGQKDPWISEQSDRVPLLISQIVCEGIRLLAQHLQQQPNPTMSHYLLGNRQHWVKHFESLWFAEKYTDFIRVKTAFDHLLQQAKLGHESAAWSLDLLKRSQQISVPIKQSDATMAWLALALHALGSDQAEQEEILTKAAIDWQKALHEFDPEAEQKNSAWFHTAVLFLQTLYRKQTQWQACRHVSEMACAIYRDKKIWPQVMQNLKILAQCCFALQDTVQGERYEKALLEELPFDTLPPNIKPQLILDVLLAKVARGDTGQAQPLLDELKQTAQSTQLSPIIDSLQADIYFKEARYAEAMKTYCHLWKTGSEHQQSANNAHINNRLIDLEKQLGKSQFEAICQQEIGEVIKPNALPASQRI